jgi:hypothetical protein
VAEDVTRRSLRVRPVRPSAAAASSR